MHPRGFVLLCHSCRGGLRDRNEVLVEHLLFVVANGQDGTIGAGDSHGPSAGEREAKLHQSSMIPVGRSGSRRRRVVRMAKPTPCVLFPPSGLPF